MSNCFCILLFHFYLYDTANVGVCYGNSVCVFVCLSVCASHVLCIKMAKHFIEILLLPDSPIILVFHHWGSLLNSDGFTPNRGAKYTGEVRKWAIFDKSVYLRNGARYGHSCYISQIGNHTQLSNGGTFDDLEWTQPPVLRSPCNSMSNISQTWHHTGFSAIAELGLVIPETDCWMYQLRKLL